ncbi:MAG: hypothetical protein JW883_06265 [Deltaproteobacteria bacterium]|nr:hypothetical protein [Deltaproteobacteria bacterium]
MSKRPTYKELEGQVKSLEKKVVQLKLLERERFQRERLQGVQEMAGAICHEFSQPMQVLFACCERSLNDLLEENPLHNHIERIMDKIERMARITKKLQKIASYETKDYIEGKKIIDIDKASRAA